MSATKAKNNVATATADREIVISRLLNAPREMVWDAWTGPRQVVEWWGPRGFTTTIHEMDVRPGGVWRHIMHGPDGTDYPNKSVFIEVVKPERIVYSHGGGRKGAPGASFEATWTFEAKGEKTLLTMRMVFPSAEARDLVVREYGAIEGGKQTLDRLEEQLEKTSIVLERTFSAPAETIWNALTEIDQMKQWYMPALESFRPEVGFETQFNIHHNGKDFLHLWRVTEVAPGRKIIYSWKYQGFPGESFVTFELFPEGNMTRLKLTHTGLESFMPRINPDLARNNFLQGWTQLGSELQKFLDKTQNAGGEEFVTSRVFEAPRALVWKAFTEPERLEQWWGPKGMPVRVGRLELRPGGVFLYSMRAPDGKDWWGKWVYREIVAPERMIFISSFCDERAANVRAPFSSTWPLEVLNTLTLAEHEGKTTLTLRGEPIHATEVERKTFTDGFKGMEKGFNGTWDQLAEYLAKG